MTSQHEFVEVQGTGEGGVFSHATMHELVFSHQQGITELLKIQEQYTS